MEYDLDDMNISLMLDGNAAGGLLDEIFALEMTDCPTECASCGKQGELGSLLAFMDGPGVVLRCPACENIVMRIVQTPSAIYLDLRGAVYLKIARA